MPNELRNTSTYPNGGARGQPEEGWLRLCSGERLAGSSSHGAGGSSARPRQTASFFFVPASGKPQQQHGLPQNYLKYAQWPAG